MNRLEAFDIRNFSLNILKEESSQLVCECPVCGGHRLTVSKETGAYQCWSGECAVALIREAIAPLPNQNGTPRRQTPKSKPVQKPKSPAPLPERINLARLPQPATDSPQPQKHFDKQHGEVEETIYSYTPDKWKTRTQWPDAAKPKGHDKTFVLWHRDSSGKAIAKAGEGIRPPYRIDEAIAVAKACGANAIVGCEGENGVEIYRGNIGLACVTLSGFSKDELALLAQMLKDAGLGLIYHPDHDQAGQNKAAKIQEACANAGVFCVVVDPVAICPTLPESGDVVEMLAAMEVPEFIRKLEQEIHEGIRRRNESLETEAVDVPDSFDPDVEFTQKARRELYGDKPWICVNNILHYWIGNHYKASLDVVETQRLWQYCNGYAVENSKGEIGYPYASPSAVKKALEWIKMAYGVDPTLINPAGLNCTNGVLQLSWVKATPSWHLVDHDPALYYTYEPVVSYNADADPINCDRLLEVLDAPQRQVFLRTIAASLDLATVRVHKGRLVRSLLLRGHGANGKDSLRECVAGMYGYQGITSASLTDFASYDQGRKFPLSRLIHSRINWASENANFDKLDKIQSLKAFTTGDPISIESKGKDEHEFTPVGIGLFNCNDTPNLTGALEAIQSRYGVLSFTKTFKIGADPSKGEIEADPRFKYDPDFLRSSVLPAFLNRVLAALVNLMAEGIDYSCTQKALEDIQAENSHLFQFAQDTGLAYSPTNNLSIGEVWEQLKQWYIDNGTLTIETSDSGKQKSLWVDQVKKSDPNVKGANQVLARIIQLFPKAKRCSLPHNKVGIQGLAFGVSQFELETSQLLANELASNPLPVREVSQLSQFSNLDEKSNEVEKDSIQRDCAELKKRNQGEKLPQLASKPDTVRVTGSAVANELANPSDQVANSESTEVALRAAIATTSEPQQPEAPVKAGDLVIINNPGSKRHGKQATVTQLRIERFQEQELLVADVSFLGERRTVEVQLSWLRRVGEGQANE